MVLDEFLTERSVGAFLTYVVEVKVPRVEEATKYASSLAKCGLKGSAFGDAMVDADTARHELIAALKREEREGANPSLHVESAREVAVRAETLAATVEVLKRSVDRQPERVKVSSLNVAWTTALAGNARPRPARATATAAAGVSGVLGFDAKMARATAALARMSCGSRLAARVASKPLKSLAEDEASSSVLSEASAELQAAAGIWGDALVVDIRDPPAECKGDVSRGFRAWCLAAADRLAIAKAFALELAEVRATPPSLAARLAAGVAANEARALDGLASGSVTPRLVGSACAQSAGAAALADALAARAAAKDSLIGEALAFSKHGLCKLNSFLQTKGNLPRGIVDDDAMARKYAASAPPDLRTVLQDLQGAIKRRVDVYDRDNKTVYFETEPTALENPVPVNLAKPRPLPADDTVVDLSEDLPAPVVEKDPVLPDDLPPPAYDDLPPAYDDLPPAFDDLPTPNRDDDDDDVFRPQSSSSSKPYVSCDRCTFNNKLGASRCEMCESKLPAC
ncbi:hypothetical protein CTAYLR_000552 [Chrysophaeum taylorii]|uniref:BRO1 domain-containing protein n=1 Tax=Chrysophaeum taylorii TaxID=2483200 RepID=A0AAD7UH69_9STRA|nr:hypothetical protein CTAYLR_000552 [Chrysophaeum taylorii]